MTFSILTPGKMHSTDNLTINYEQDTLGLGHRREEHEMRREGETKSRVWGLGSRVW
jgi:hypothetical protein